MSKKFIFVDANGDYTESAGAFEITDFVSVSAGGVDSGKPVLLDGTGKLDVSLFDQTDIDHGSISGLGDDDHTIYTKADGTRAFTGNQSMGGNRLTNLGAGTSGSDAVNKSQLDFAVAGLQDFRDSILDKDLLTPPVSPATGDRYLIGNPTDTATGVWATHEGNITEWNGSAWIYEAIPDEGTYVYIEDENTSYIFNSNTFASGIWVIYTQATVLAGNGIGISGNTVSVDLYASGGLKFIGSAIALEPTDFAGTGLQDDGSDNLEIDFADPATEMNTSRAVKASDLYNYGSNQGSKILGADTLTFSHSTATTVQGVFSDFDAAITATAIAGSSFTVGAGGCVKGDLVYIASANTVLPKVSLTTNTHGVGLASSSEAAAGTVKVVKSGSILTGVLSGATAGVKYYWSGSVLQTAVPTASGAYVYLAGVAKNATDLDVNVEFVKKNS
jgi:hypothetical protein